MPDEDTFSNRERYSVRVQYDLEFDGVNAIEALAAAMTAIRSGKATPSRQIADPTRTLDKDCPLDNW